MSTRVKVILTIFFLLLVSAGGYYLWYLGEKRQNAQSQGNGQENEQAAGAEQSGLSFLTTNSVHSPVLAFDKLSIWYFESSSSHLLRQHLENSADIKMFPLADHEAIRFAVWPDAGSDFIVATEKEKLLYNSAANAFVPYPEAVKFIAWLPGGQRVAYIWSDQQEAVLSVARPSLSEHRVIARLPDGNFWLVPGANGRGFALFRPGGSEIFYVVDGLGVLETIRQGGLVSHVKFSPDGTKIAFIEDKGGTKLLTLMNLANRAETVAGEISGDFVWSQSGRYLYWHNGYGVIKRFDLEANVSATALENLTAQTWQGVEVFLAGRDDHELFFIEGQTGRLGKIRFE